MFSSPNVPRAPGPATLTSQRATFITTNLSTTKSEALCFACYTVTVYRSSVLFIIYLLTLIIITITTAILIGVVPMGNVAHKVAIESTYLAIWVSVLTISPPRLPDVHSHAYLTMRLLA